jgi:hypothetical protein
MQQHLKLWQYLTTRDRMFWMEWSSTFILIIGVVLTSFNIFPANVYFSLLGNVGWAIVSVAWKKWSLLVIQAVVSIIYLIGLIAHYSV